MIDVDNGRQQILYRRKANKRSHIIKTLLVSFNSQPIFFQDLSPNSKFPKLTDKVFPDPVCATPTISNPLRATGHP